MITATATLEYEGKQYTVTESYHESWYEGAECEPAYYVEFTWSDGNNSCDCNRSALIAEQCDEMFPMLECGDEIKLVSLQLSSMSPS